MNNLGILFMINENLTLEEIKEFAVDDAISWDGFDDAVIGIDVSGRLVYDIDVMIDILVQRDKMEVDEAMEYLDYNVLHTIVGESTPIHVRILR